MYGKINLEKKTSVVFGLTSKKIQLFPERNYPFVGTGIIYKVYLSMRNIDANSIAS